MRDLIFKAKSSLLTRVFVMRKRCNENSEHFFPEFLANVMQCEMELFHTALCDL